MLLTPEVGRDYERRMQSLFTTRIHSNAGKLSQQPMSGRAYEQEPEM